MRGNYFRYTVVKVIWPLMAVLLYTINSSAVTTYQHTGSISSNYIDASLKDAHLLKNALPQDDLGFYLFSHGRPGELLINNKWLDAPAIKNWLQKNELLQNKEYLYIYGCYFAQGEKGRAAVTYLEKELDIQVAASTNLTGTGGNWILEVGNQLTPPLVLSSYSYNLQSTIASDNFSSNTFSGGTGWATASWTTTGSPTVSSGRVFSDGGADRSFARRINLSGYSSVLWTADWNCDDSSSGFESGDQTFFQVSYDNGVSYTTLQTLTAPCGTNQNNTGGVSLDISGGNPNTWIRILTSNDSGNEDMFFDNIILADPCTNGAIVGTPTANDPDADGINNDCDLDDDNDGILDCEEKNLTGTVSEYFNITGNASETSVNEFQLTPNLNNQSGQAWSFGRTNFNRSFVINFEANFGTNNNGADGIAVTFHNDPLGFNVVGNTGIAIGSGGIQNGIAIEFDTFQNALDIAADHATFWETDQAAPNTTLRPDVALGASGNIEDGQWHTVTISWNIDTQTLSYLFDNVYSDSYTNNNFVNTFFAGTSNVYFGFTASTDGSTNTHSIRIANACSLPVSEDSDNDGIINSLDLDSDNDGCPDAIEGGGAFTTADILNDTLTGGVDANGIPNVVSPAGQTIGDSVIATQLTVNTAPINQIATPSSSVAFDITTRADNATSYTGIAPNTTPVYGTPGNANAGINYQWYLGDPDASGTALTNASPYNNVTSATLNISDATGLGGNEYFVVVTHDENACIREVNSAFLIDACDPIASGNIDTDGDGVSDICDLDDDNDGILDVEECSQTTDILSTFGLANIDNSNNGAVTIPGTTVTYDFTENGGSISVQNLNGGGQQGPVFYLSGGASQDVTVDMVFATNFINPKFTISDFDTSETVVVTLYDDTNNIINLTGSARVTVGSQITQSGANGTTFTNTTNNNINGNLISSDPLGSVVFDFSDQEISRITVTATFAQNSSLRYTQITFCGDSDIDSIRDHLDSDSDNDGCFDVVESGGIDANNDGVLDGTGFDTDGLVTGGAGGYNGITGNEYTATQLQITAATTNQTVNNGAVATFSLTARGDQTTTFVGTAPATTPSYTIPGNANAGIKYQWYLDDPDAGGAAIPGETNASLNITATEALDGQQYFVVITHVDYVCAREVQSGTLSVLLPNIALVRTAVFNDTNANGCTDASETVTYTFQVSNLGNSSLTAVSLTDVEVPAITFVNGDTDADNELDTTETWVYTATYSILQTDVDAGFITNQATAQGTSGTETVSDLSGSNTSNDLPTLINLIACGVGGNSFFGERSGNQNTKGVYNNFFGNAAGLSNVTGNHNLFIGENSGFALNQGNYNVFIGKNAGVVNTSSNHNTFLGSYTGATNTGQGNIFIGHDADGLVPNANDLFVLQNDNLDTSLIYGDFQANTLLINGRLIIQNKLNLSPKAQVPSAPNTGDIYYDSSDNKLKVWTGSIWEPLN
jgi:hypothetical protein